MGDALVALFAFRLGTIVGKSGSGTGAELELDCFCHVNNVFVFQGVPHGLGCEGMRGGLRCFDSKMR